MNTIIKYFLLIIVVAGLSAWVTARMVPREALVVTDDTAVQAPSVPVDPYVGWSEIILGNVISLHIPPTCRTAVDSTLMFCDEPGNETPLPVMAISSNGGKVSLRRWENLVWSQWDAVIGSLKIKSPLDRSVEIIIDK